MKKRIAYQPEGMKVIEKGNVYGAKGKSLVNRKKSKLEGNTKLSLNHGPYMY